MTDDKMTLDLSAIKEELRAYRLTSESTHVMVRMELNESLLAEVERLQAKLDVAVKHLEGIGLAKEVILDSSVYLFREYARAALDRIEKL